MENVQDLKYTRRQRAKTILFSILNHFIIVVFAAFILVPLYVVIITSFKTTAEANGTAFYWWPKEGLSLDGYIKIFSTNQVNRNLIRAFGVTLWMYVPPIIVGIFVSAMAAYGFAKMDFFLKKPIFAILMSSLTLPNSVGMIASIVIYNGIGWMGTPLPLMIPRMMGSIGIVFFLRQFYMGLPDDLIGAARVDGLGDYGIFLRVALPLSMPALSSQFILTFIAAYNDYLGPLYYLIGSPELYPLQLSLSYWRTSSNPDWSVLMAGAMVATIPMLCLYLLSQKFILKGVTITSGLKG
ncbi:MAG: hypothetical protein DBX59_03980 [Bacillota bacterium]|nr:MAG: hypothetical protein DBX59_03980 [Bacillota bacterium]